jgi:hypothetical protein
MKSYATGGENSLDFLSLLAELSPTLPTSDDIHLTL